ncbi:MAG TPA: hypothetical protein DGG94_06935 [Micromonosporaceae bacterium]|nr:hypothetical protein [Micromonosporaceae bacterium]
MGMSMFRCLRLDDLGRSVNGEGLTLSILLRAVLTMTLSAGLIGGMPAVASAAAEPGVPGEVSVPLTPLVPDKTPVAPMPGSTKPVVAWPRPGSAIIDVSAAGSRTAVPVVRVGGLPVTVSAVQNGAVAGVLGSASLEAEPAPSKVRVEVLDRAKAGGTLALRVSRADGGSGPAKVRVSLDYSAFRLGFGAGWESRLEMRLLPECGLGPVTPVQALRKECTGIDLPVVNDMKTGVISADVDFMAPVRLPAVKAGARESAVLGEPQTSASSLDGSQPLIVTMASSSESEKWGSFSKTDLKQAGSWASGTNSGDFTYSYPIDVPGVPGELEPEIELAYSSQSVDGQTSSEHGQSGLVGEGWSLSAGGFIETTYRPCKEDKDHPQTWTSDYDTCHRHENYQLSWGGRSGELVPTGTPNVWKTANDDGTLVEYVTFSGVGAYWRVTTSDGTQWWFGKREVGGRATNSVLTREMWANDSSEPCYHPSGFAYSHCTVAYRWNLDYVVDAHGNSMSYWYDKYTNQHATGGGEWGLIAYDRDAVLSRIEYGTRAGSETATPPAMVQFTNADRCVTDCWSGGTRNSANWIDTPFDLECNVGYAGPCANNRVASFWTDRRLAGITTRVKVGASGNFDADYRKVDSWAMTHQFPDNFYSGAAYRTLWLSGITRTGFDAAGTSSTLPRLVTYGKLMQSRADYDPNSGMLNHWRYRLEHLETETGARITATYAPVEDICTWKPGKTDAEWPNYNHNASRCFQQWYVPKDPVKAQQCLSNNSCWSRWHKYVVEKVTEDDLVGGSPDVVTSYEYKMDGAGSNLPLVTWTYASNPFGTIKKSMSTWRGYPTVITRTGPAGGVQTKTKRLYHRGVHRDTGLDAGQAFWRTGTVTDSTGGVSDDHQALAGLVREEIVYNGESESDAISKTVHHFTVTENAGQVLPSWQTPPERRAYHTGETATVSYQKLADGTWRPQVTRNAYDTGLGNLTSTQDGGVETDGGADDVCTKHSYVVNVNQLISRTTGANGQPGAGTWLGADWSTYDVILTPGDFAGDGRSDVLARNKLNSHLYLFRGQSNGTLGTPERVGDYWTGTENTFFTGGDFSGDNIPDVLYRDETAAHDLWMLYGNGSGGWGNGANAVRVGWGWAESFLFSPGDITADAKMDVLYRRANDGNLVVLRGNGAAGWIDGVNVVAHTGDWRIYDKIFGRGDVTGDGKADVYARVAATGELKLFPGTGSSTGSNAFGTPISLGLWNNNRLLAAADLSGDGRADLLTGQDGPRITDTVARSLTVTAPCSPWNPAYPGRCCLRRTVPLRRPALRHPTGTWPAHPDGYRHHPWNVRKQLGRQPHLHQSHVRQLRQAVNY